MGQGVIDGVERVAQDMTIVVHSPRPVHSTSGIIQMLLGLRATPASQTAALSWWNWCCFSVMR